MTTPPKVNRSIHKGEDVIKDESSLNHSCWECKYYIVWIPKYRRKVLFGQLRKYLGHRQSFTGQQFWSRGYHVSTVGRDEETIREYVKEHGAGEQRIIARENKFTLEKQD